MKPRSDSIRALASALDQKRRKLGLSYNALGKISDVDPGQACRICRGHFQTFSQNVLRICNALKMPIPIEGTQLAETSQVDPRLQAALVGAWDRSTEGTDRLINLLDALSRYQGPSARAGRKVSKPNTVGP